MCRKTGPVERAVSGRQRDMAAPALTAQAVLSRPASQALAPDDEQASRVRPPSLLLFARSAIAQKYAIASLAEAESYIAHPLLGPRLFDCRAS